MTSKIRAKKALNHQQPDQVPIDFGSTGVTGMHVYAVAGLRKHYRLEQRPVKVHEPYQMLGLIEPDLQEVIGVDVEGIYGATTLFGFRNENWKPWRMSNGLDVLVPEDFKTTLDKNGDFLIYPEGDLSAPPSGRMPKNGYFFDTIIRQEPIDEANLNPEDNLEEFKPISDTNLAYFAQAAQQAADTGRLVIGGFGGTGLGDIALVPAPFLKHPKGIRDIEEWYVSTVIRQDYIHQIFEKQIGIALQNLAKIKPLVANLVDVLFICGTDFGTQSSTFCSEATFRKLYMPYYKKVNDWVHQNTEWKTFKHSCGSVRSLLPAMIESGFDIINPVQCSAANMDPVELKQEFGKQLVFWGGGVDTQKTLAFGKPEEVRQEVLKRCEIFGRDGGFVFNAIHNVQANTPLENIVAMIEALREFNA